jgi:hypothetical protein
MLRQRQPFVRKVNQARFHFTVYDKDALSPSTAP